VRHRYLQIKYLWARPSVHHWVNPLCTLIDPWDWAGTVREAGPLYFGYYDKSPWSPDGDRLVLHFRPGREVELRVFQRSTRSCTRVGQSRAWNYQQGSMTQWVTYEGQPALIYNDVRNSELVSRLITPEGRELQTFGMPVQAVHPDGGMALGLNYRRLWRLRREYGYATEVRSLKPDLAPDKDGIWRLDFASGRVDLIITLSDLAASRSNPKIDAANSKVNHFVFSPRGKRCIFMYRWFDTSGKSSRLYSMSTEDFRPQLVLDTGLISHYNWRDDENLLIYGASPDGLVGYFELNVVSGAHRRIGPPELDVYGDGHPSLSPDKTWVITDSYPDRHFNQHLLLFPLSSGELTELGWFSHSPNYYRVTRCDLHPRWSPLGNAISFDSVWHGTRNSYILDISRLIAS
jgi:hypothetical protein